MEKLIASMPVIVEDGYLLVTRDWKDEFYKLPGGRLQEGEDLESCALRRFRDETGFDAEIVAELSTMYLDKKPVTGEDIEMELHHFRAQLKERPENLEGFEHADYEVKWLNIRDIIEGKFNVAPNITFLFEKGEIEPWIDYVFGTKKKFFEFVSMITPGDKVAIVTHTDPDGLISGVLLEQLFEAKKIDVAEIEFIEMEIDMVKKVNVKLKEKNISKVFFCDLGVDSEDLEGLQELSKDMDFFILDHHPSEINSEFEDKMIKCTSDDCAAMLVYDLGKELFDSKEWEWLLAAAMFADYSYQTSKNFEILQRIYPSATKENLGGSIPGINARKINSAMRYYLGNLNHVYELVKKRDLGKLSEAHDIIEDEVNRLVDDVVENSEFLPEKNLYFYEIKSSFRLSSTVSSISSKMGRKGTFIVYQKWSDGVHLSARNRDAINYDMGVLLRESIEGLKGASGGGHKKAAGAGFRESDLGIVLDRIKNSSMFDIGGV